MRAWIPKSVHDDPPKDPEILNWFQTLGPPPQGQASPQLRAKVRARIAQLQARPGFFAWVPRLLSPAWGTALAMALVLSMGLNIWWGIRGVRLPPPDDRQATAPPLGPLNAAGRLRTYHFQREMAQAHLLGTLVAAQPARWEPSTVVGFIPQAARPTFFRIGTLYADTLAALHGGPVEAATQRLDLLRRALASVQAPRVLPQYLRTIQTQLQSQPDARAEVALVLALFEPLYAEAYATTDTAEHVTLFQAGAWLENLALAAAAGDGAALQQGSAMVAQVRRALTQLQAPPDVLEALARLRALLTRPALTAHELTAIRALIQDIQRQLSA